MAKNAHPKRARALRMMTPAEISSGISPFNCAAWHRRSLANHEKEKAQFYRTRSHGKKKVLGVF